LLTQQQDRNLFEITVKAMEKTLPEGIYEQIVNARLKGYLEKLNPEQYDVDIDHLDADDARKILTIYMSGVIEQGLRIVREGHGLGEDADALLDQITLCNNIIDKIASYAHENAVLDSKITEKGEILTALYKKMNSLRAVSAVKAPRPETSILENSLFTGSS
jgi:hypothetical protein